MWQDLSEILPPHLFKDIMACSGCSGCSECTAMVMNPVYSPIVPRSMVVQPGSIVRLGFLFRGQIGEVQDTDVFPSVSIINTHGHVVIGPTSQGVSRAGTGEYYFDYALGNYPDIGVWRDVWEGLIEGIPVRGEGTFQVNTTQLPAQNTDGYQHIGDTPGYCYSQNAICNINKLLKALKARLKSAGIRSSCDEFGNVIYETCDIFSTDELVTFLGTSIAAFNAIPTLTFYDFDSNDIVNLFFEPIVQHAMYQALAGQALIERGAEFQVSDAGLAFQPPTLSELLSTMYQKEMDNWYDKIKLIKMNLRPSPIAVLSASSMGASSQIRRLRFLRARRILN